MGQIPPLSAGEKFKVTARGVFDPFEFVLIGFVAGINQASNNNPSYGQGMQGYAKRYGTAYADNAIENFTASALFPSLLHQDPRYYQLGRGGFWRRAEHAVGRVLILARANSTIPSWAADLLRRRFRPTAITRKVNEASETW